MKRVSDLYAKLYFWFENALYLWIFVVYEAILVPFIIFKVLFMILRLSDIISAVPLILVWIILSPVILLVNLLIDLFNIMRILCDYQTTENKSKDIEMNELK